MSLLKPYRLPLLLLLLLPGTCALAQTPADSTAAIDSAVIASDTSAVPESTVDANDAVELFDTALVSQIRYISKDSLALLKKDKGYYYQNWIDSALRAEQEAELHRKRKDIDTDIGFDLSGFYRALKYITAALLLAVLVLVIIRFIRKDLPLRRNRKNIATEIPVEETPSADQYESKIREAVGQQDFRLAIRYLHLQTLQRLADKKIIQLGSNKTNSEYVQEVRSRAPLVATEFSQLNRNYEYAWYGEYPVTMQAYESLEARYKKLQRENS